VTRSQPPSPTRPGAASRSSPRNSRASLLVKRPPWFLSHVVMVPVVGCDAGLRSGDGASLDWGTTWRPALDQYALKAFCSRTKNLPAVLGTVRSK
jgi:hypothetical protein